MNIDSKLKAGINNVTNEANTTISLLGLGLGLNIGLGFAEVHTASRAISIANNSTLNSKTKSNILTNNRSIGSYSRYILSTLSPISSSSSRLTSAISILTNTNAATSNPAAFLQQHLLTHLHNSYKVYSRLRRFSSGLIVSVTLLYNALVFKDGKKMREDDVLGGKAAININNYTANSNNIGLVFGDDDTITTSFMNQITNKKYNNNDGNNHSKLLPILVGGYRSPLLTTIIDKVSGNGNTAVYLEASFAPILLRQALANIKRKVFLFSNIYNNNVDIADAYHLHEKFDDNDVNSTIIHYSNNVTNSNFDSSQSAIALNNKAILIDLSSSLVPIIVSWKDKANVTNVMSKSKAKTDVNDNTNIMNIGKFFDSLLTYRSNTDSNTDINADSNRENNSNSEGNDNTGTAHELLLWGYLEEVGYKARKSIDAVMSLLFVISSTSLHGLDYTVNTMNKVRIFIQTGLKSLIEARVVDKNNITIYTDINLDDTNPLLINIITKLRQKGYELVPLSSISRKETSRSITVLLCNMNDNNAIEKANSLISNGCVVFMITNKTAKPSNFIKSDNLYNISIHQHIKTINTFILSLDFANTKTTSDIANIINRKQL